MALKDEIQLGFIPADVFLFFVHDESGVSLDPMTYGLIKPVQGSNVDQLDTNLLLVSLGQFTKPAAEKEIIFFHLLWVFVKVPLIPLSPQTHLVCN